MQKHFIFLLLLLSLSAILAQKTDSIPPSATTGKGGKSTDSIMVAKTDTVVKKLKKPFRFRRNEFHFILQTTFLANAASSAKDSIPLFTIGSGSTTLGAGYNFNVSPKFAIHLQPGVTYYKLSYRQLAAKNFPTRIDTFQTEKHRMTYAEFPIGLIYTFKRNEKKERQFFAELGGFAGIQFKSLYKITYTETFTDGNIHNMTQKIQFIPNANPIRYGLYGRVGKGLLSVYGSYRLSNVFLTQIGQISYPITNIPRLEIGFSMVL